MISGPAAAFVHNRYTATAARLNVFMLPQEMRVNECSLSAGQIWNRAVNSRLRRAHRTTAGHSSPRGSETKTEIEGAGHSSRQHLSLSCRTTRWSALLACPKYTL